jgi:hypothetical protein
MRPSATKLLLYEALSYSEYLSLNIMRLGTSGNTPLHTPAYVSIRQHTSAYVSICQHTSAYVRIRQHTSAYLGEHALIDLKKLASIHSREIEHLYCRHFEALFHNRVWQYEDTDIVV